MKLVGIALPIVLSSTLHVAHGFESLPAEWKLAFPIAAAPEHVYFRAHYLDDHGQAHLLQAWRDGDRHLRRQTDDAIDLYVNRGKADDIDLQLVDHKRRVIIRADGLSLLHVGRFGGWLGLAHALDIPHGPYGLSKVSETPSSRVAGECVWFRLQTTTPSFTVNDICWSHQWGLPLLILRTNNKGEHIAQFTIDEVGVFKPDLTTFAVRSEGLIEVDARSGDSFD